MLVSSLGKITSWGWGDVFVLQVLSPQPRPPAPPAPRGSGLQGALARLTATRRGPCSRCKPKLPSDRLGVPSAREPCLRPNSRAIPVLARPSSASIKRTNCSNARGVAPNKGKTGDSYKQPGSSLITALQPRLLRRHLGAGLTALMSSDAHVLL